MSAYDPKRTFGTLQVARLKGYPIPKLPFWGLTMRRREFISLLGGAAAMPWVGSIGLAAAVGLAYFLTARFSVRLILESSGVAVFWPAAGISSGLLIALGPQAR